MEIKNKYIKWEKKYLVVAMSQLGYTSFSL